MDCGKSYPLRVSSERGRRPKNLSREGGRGNTQPGKNATILHVKRSITATTLVKSVEFLIIMMVQSLPAIFITMRPDRWNLPTAVWNVNTSVQSIPWICTLLMKIFSRLFVREEGYSDQSCDGESDVVNDDVPSSSDDIEHSPNGDDDGDPSNRPLCLQHLHSELGGEL